MMVVEPPAPEASPGRQEVCHVARLAPHRRFSRERRAARLWLAILGLLVAGFLVTNVVGWFVGPAPD